MGVRKNKKSRKLRGSRCCGFGTNKHRGAGQRGGRGRAGSGKKCHSKKPSIWGTKPSHLGVKGFKLRCVSDTKAINIASVESQLENWLYNKLISKEKEVYVVDLGKVGYNKLLSAGRVTRKMKITVWAVSANAEAKLKAGGCEVIRPEK